MSRPSRESVFSALFSVLQGCYDWKTCSRRLVNVQDVQPEEFPAAFQLQGTQAQSFKGAAPSIGQWHASWLLYAYSTDPTVAPSTALNAMVDAVMTALAPNNITGQFTLGGLVTYAAVDGDIEIFEGVLGDRAIAIVPIRIVVPGF
jgi:hypothetical protein